MAIGQSTESRFEAIVPPSPEELLSRFDHPVVVGYDFRPGGVTTLLGNDLDVVDTGAIVAHEVFTADRPDDEWRGLANRTRRFVPDGLRQLEGGFQVVDTAGFSIQVLREGTVAGSALTPARAMNGMFSAAQELLTAQEARDFELIVEGLIEVNGRLIDRPTDQDFVYLNAGPNHHTVFLQPEFRRLGSGLIVAGKETLTWRGDSAPRAYDKWEHTTRSRVDRGQFAHSVRWNPGVMRLEPQVVTHSGGLQVVHGETSQIVTASVDDIVAPDGSIASPYEFTRQA